MNKLIKAGILLFLILATAGAYAQTIKEDDIDYEYDFCKLKDSSSSNIRDCAFRAYEKWNKQLDNAYKRFEKSLKDDDKPAFKQAQTSWEAFRDAEFNSYDYMFNKSGSNWCELREDNRIAIVRARALQLRSYFEAKRLINELHEGKK